MEIGRDRLQITCMILIMLGLPIYGAVRMNHRLVEGPADLHAGALQRKTLHRSHYLVEMRGRPQAKWIAQWAGRGIRVTGAIPPSAVMVSVPDGADPVLGGVLWASRLGAADKLSTMVGTA